MTAPATEVVHTASVGLDQLDSPRRRRTWWQSWWLALLPARRRLALLLELNLLNRRYRVAHCFRFLQITGFKGALVFTITVQPVKDNRTSRAHGQMVVIAGTLDRRQPALAQGQAHLSNFEAAGQALMGIEPSQRL